MHKIQLKTVAYYNLHEIMEEMERRGFMPKRKFWHGYVCEWGVKNDTIFWLGFNYYSDTPTAEQYKEYFDEVNKILNLPPDNDGIMVEVSW